MHNGANSISEENYVDGVNMRSIASSTEVCETLGKIYMPAINFQ